MVKTKEDLSEVILEKASELFRKQGYTATSIKQIAEACGCTTAALYYYFEEGKRHILREVIQISDQMSETMIPLPEADSLGEFILKLNGIISTALPKIAERTNWIMNQLETLPEEEKKVIQGQFLKYQAQLQQQISKYMENEDEAKNMAWFLLCSVFGYSHIFSKMQIGQAVDLPLDEYVSLLSRVATK